jgi:hypothetical protein
LNERLDEKTESSEDDILRKGVRQIVLSRETIPRAPRWARAFRRTLLRFVRDIAEAEEDGASETAHNTHPPEEISHDES